MSLRAGQGQGAERRLRRADRPRGAPDLRLPVDAQGTGTEGPLFVSLSNKTMGRRLKTRSLREVVKRAKGEKFPSFT